MVGRASPRSLPIRLLTSPHDAIISNRWRSPQANFNTRCDGTRLSWKCVCWLSFIKPPRVLSAVSDPPVGMWSTRLRCPHVHRPWAAGLRARRPSARDSRAPDEGGAGCTTRFENAHGNSSQELVYRWHPWCDRRVWVREAIEKPGGLVFRCALSDSVADRGLEVPAWMFDRAACAKRAMLSDAPFARMAALSALADLLAGALKARASPPSNLPLFGASRVSRDQNRGDPHAGKESCASKAVVAEGGRTRPSAPIDEAVGVVRRRSARLHNRSADVAGPAERDAACPDGADGAA